MAEFEDTYTHLPLTLDPTSKNLTAPSMPNDAKLQSALTSLNALHTSLKSLDTPNQVPPAPVPVNPKRSANINKMKDTASTAHRRATYPDAIKLYTYAIDMAAGRPGWEPVGLVREELSLLYSNRAQSFMAMSDWVSGWKDAEQSVECKRNGNQKAWWRAGKCLGEMGRWADAVNWLEKAVEVEGKDGEGGKELVSLLAETRKERERGSLLGT
ncbi:MAG: hypothetical protein Q9227_004375 [Pyrenula ochraceoflavens]